MRLQSQTPHHHSDGTTSSQLLILINVLQAPCEDTKVISTI